MIRSNMWLAAVLTAVFAFGTVSCGSKGKEVEEVDVEVSDTLDMPLGFCPDSMRVVDGKVKSGQFFSTLPKDYDESQSYPLVFFLQSGNDTGRGIRTHHGM